MEPTRFPKVPDRTTPTELSFPVEARKPENGIMISLGIGIKALSSIIRKNIPGIAHGRYN